MPIANFDLKDFDQGLNRRWGQRNWNIRFPWWGPPSKVRILMVGDSNISLNGGSFDGLQYVYQLLKSRAYHFVDFKVDFVNRDGQDPNATISGAKKLTELDILNQYDEIFFFGFVSAGDLDAEEHALLRQFMAAPKLGGVLVTGDHANLGKRLAGQIQRAGKMRLYPAPNNFAPDWNSTVRDGPDPLQNFDHHDQSDDKPQPIRWKRYALSSGSPGVLSQRPHPVLCGMEGPIAVLPDHQHEGEAVAPVVAAGDSDWPTKYGHQERPEVIAWGRIHDPLASKHGQEFGVLSAYNGHNVDVGRILADSTWHHWFDVNLLGIADPPSPYAGFDATAAGQAVLKQLDAFFLNVGVWLAPPQRQAEMRRAAWWSILWSDRIVEMHAQGHLGLVGEQAINALGLRAPRCTVSRWIFDLPIFKEKIPHWEWPMFQDRVSLVDLPFERFVAGGILMRLNKKFGPLKGGAIPKSAPDAAAFDAEIAAGAQDGLTALADVLKSDIRQVSRLVETGFNVSQALR